jgi:SAM-dependent methyltransferase
VRWLLKACMQKIASSLPWSASVNCALRRYGSKTLPVSSATFNDMLFIAEKHYAFFLNHSPAASLHKPLFFEFGAGCDLISQLYFHARGIKKQFAVDVKPHAKLALINDAIERLQCYRQKTEGNTDQQATAHAFASMAELNALFGINYLAPCDMRNTNFPSESFDFISSTATLEHIPCEDLAHILAECRRLLRPSCIISCLIDPKDHYAYCDRHVSIYNFLKFSDRTWALCNSSLHFQNRLRYPDYVNMFETAGFEILVCQAEQPTDSDIACLKSLHIDSKFTGSLEDMGVKTIWIAAKKK